MGSPFRLLHPRHATVKKYKIKKEIQQTSRSLGQIVPVSSSPAKKHGQKKRSGLVPLLIVARLCPATNKAY